MLNQKAEQIAKLALTTPSVDAIAEQMGITKLAVLGSYGALKKEGLATYENGNIILTEAGVARFDETALSDTDQELMALIDVLTTVDIDTIQVREGTRKATYHKIITENPGKTKAELNKLLQAATGLPRRNCYVIQYGYEKELGLH